MSKAKETSLTTIEQRKLTNQETVIQDHVESFVKVGNALANIRVDKLYRDYADTFEGYCKKRWGFAKSRAYQLIDAAKVIDVVSTIVDKKGHTYTPANEAQARILSDLPDEQTQATVWTKAIETAPKDKDGEPRITAAHVKRVAEEVSPKQPPIVPEITEDEPDTEEEAEPVDAIGTALPKKTQAAFAESKEFEQLNRDLNEINKRLETLAGISPFLHLQTVQADISNVKRAVKFAKPYAVCGYCNGKGCEACKSTGWVPKNIYESTPENAA